MNSAHSFTEGMDLPKVTMIRHEYNDWTWLGTYTKERSDMIMKGFEVVDSVLQQKDQYIIGWISYVKGYVIYQKKNF